MLVVRALKRSGSCVHSTKMAMEMTGQGFSPPQAAVDFHPRRLGVFGFSPFCISTFLILCKRIQQ